MLEYLRNAADKPVAKILMGILIFSFVGWGVAEWVFGLTASDTTLMKIGGTKVSIQQYTSLKSNELAKLSREEQRKLYTDPREMHEFQNRVIGQLAKSYRLNKHANDLGYVVSDHRIANDIRAIPQFQENGKFSPAAFDAVLRNSGLTESDLAFDLRTQILNSMVSVPAKTQIATPKFTTVAAYNARNAKRDLNMATVKFADFKVGAPTDNQLRDFYNQNPHKVAETRDISYILVTAEMDKPDDYERGLKIAQKTEDDVIAGEELATVAKKHNAKHKVHKDLSANNLPKDKALTDTVIARMFEMDEGTESELIETKEGFVIVRVDKIVPEHNAEFDSIKKDLTTEWTRAEQKKQAYVRANELLVDLNKTKKLANSKQATVSRTDGAPTPVLVAAFKEAIGTNTIVSGDDAFYVIQIGNEKLAKQDSAKLDALKKDLDNMSMKHLEADYNAYLERQYPMKLNEKTYNRFVK